MTCYNGDLLRLNYWLKLANCFRPSPTFVYTRAITKLAAQPKVTLNDGNKIPALGFGTFAVKRYHISYLNNKLVGRKKQGWCRRSLCNRIWLPPYRLRKDLRK